MAADSTSVASGLQPGRGGTPALPPARFILDDQRSVVALPSQLVTLPSLHQSHECHDTYGWRPDEGFIGAGPCVPDGAQLHEYWWQVLLDNGIWQDVDRSWNAPLFAAVRDGLSRLVLALPRVDYREKLYGEMYFIDCRHPRWITQENIRTGHRRALRAVQGVRVRLPYVQLAPPPEHPPPVAASEQPTASAGPATQVPPWSPAYPQPGPPSAHPPPAAASEQPTASAGPATQVPPRSPAYVQPDLPPAHSPPATVWGRPLRL